MYGSSSCNINMKYNPGYVAIDTIKKNHTNKTNLVKKISGVKIKPHATPVSNQSFEVPFIAVDSGERVYSSCEIPLKQSFPTVKFILTLSAIMLVSGGAVYGVNHALRSGGGAVNEGNFGVRSGGGAVNEGNLGVRYAGEASGSGLEVKHSIAHPIAPKSFNLKVDFNSILNRGMPIVPEVKASLGLKALYDYNESVGKLSSPVSKHIFETVKKSINKDITQVLSDFNETIEQNNKWLNTANNIDKLSIKSRINIFEAARDEIQQLGQNIKRLEVHSNKNVKYKAKSLITLINNFRQKYDYVKLDNSVSSKIPQNMFSISQSLESRVARLQKLTG